MDEVARKLSIATAKGYSLHVGVNRIDPNHYGSDGALLACEFDAQAMLEVAQEAGYESLPLLLTKDATRENVKASIREVATRMAPNDIFFLSYAGHGGQLKDLNEDEDDGLDETWCLYDAQLSDDELYDLWATFPAGSRILVVSDSCHSGSVVRAGRGDLFAETPPESTSQTAEMPRPRALPPRQISRTYMRNRDFYDQTLAQSGTAELRGTIPVSVRLLSGCQDNQLSMDGPFNGAFTTQLLKVWDKGRYDSPYNCFQREIVQRMPETQTPVHFQAGVANALFDQQRPFQI